ncbi:MAG: amino acid permease [Chitinophagales bacterium]|nr:amino acid permease [Chitinophagales bacterium]
MPIQPRLKQFDLIMLVVSMVIGVGIFRTPAIVAQHAQSPFVFYLAWILGGIVSICGALTFAEIGSRLPAAGGYYKIFSAAYHPAYAFMLNWSQVIINAGSAAGVAIIGAEYIQPVLFPTAINPLQIVQIIAVSIIIILFAINYAGIKMGARTQNILSTLKIILILLFCSALFTGKSNPNSTTAFFNHDINLVTAIGLSFISIFFTFGGYQQSVNFGADVEHPQKNIPAGIIKGMAIVIVLYLLLNITYVKVLGFDGVKESPLLAAAVGEQLFGTNGGRIASIILFISVLGFLNTSVMSNPRVYYAMAEDKTLPAIFKKVNTKTQTQEFGLSFFVAVMLSSIFALGSFEKIVNYVIFIDSISLATAGFAVYILRRKTQDTFTGFQLKNIWRNIIPAIFIITLLFVTYNTVLSDAESAAYGFLILIAGLPLYYGLRKLMSGG